MIGQKLFWINYYPTDLVFRNTWTLCDWFCLIGAAIGQSGTNVISSYWSATTVRTVARFVHENYLNLWATPVTWPPRSADLNQVNSLYKFTEQMQLVAGEIRKVSSAFHRVTTSFIAWLKPFQLIMNFILDIYYKAVNGGYLTINFF